MTNPSRFDRDPDALAWARAKVQAEIERAEKFVEQATAQGATEGAEFWRRHALHLHRSFVGGEGCVMGRFDERRPALTPPPPAGQAPATDRAALRDRIAEALANADGWELEEGLTVPRLSEGQLAGYRHRADAVLSVLPASVDWAAETERLRTEHATWRKLGQRNLERAHQENADLRADQGAALERILVAVRRLAAHAVGFGDVLDESDRGPWGKTVAADIAELRRLAAESVPAVVGRADNETQDQTDDYERTTGHLITCVAVAGGNPDPDCPCAAAAQQPKETRP